MDRTARAVEPLAPGADALDRGRVVKAETEVGTLWLERDAELVTPAIVETGAWAPELTALAFSVLRKGMTFVDVGANIGYLSVLASRLVGPGGRVFCVEADPGNVEILRANLWRNGCSNAQVLQVAAWDDTDELNLVTNPAGGAGSTVDRDPEMHPGTPVPALRLDDLIDGDVDYLKVDCEGTDHRVVHGAAGLIGSNPSMVISVEHMAAHADAAVGTYRGLGLHPYEIRGLGRLEATSFEDIVARGAAQTILFDYALSTHAPRGPTSRVATLRRAAGLALTERGYARRRLAESPLARLLGRRAR